MARPRTHDDAVRRRLIDRAALAISRSGPEGLSLRTVATEASTTTAAVYSLFGSREGLVAAVVEEGFRRFGAHLAAAPGSEDPVADLLALGVAYRTSALADPHYYRAMFAPGHAVAGDVEAPGPNAAPTAGASRAAVARPTFLALRAAVERVLRAQRREAADAEEVALHLWSLAHGLVSLELAGLLPGDAGERAQRYAAALRSMRV